MRDSSIRELGQFLVGPAALFTTPSPWLLLGLAAVCITLTLAVVFLLRPLAREVRAVHILAAIPLVALATVLLVLISQWFAESISSKPLYAASRVAGANFGSPKQIIGKYIFLLVAYVVGWGQSRSLVDDTFEQHVLSFTVGTGVVEEVVKALAGFALAGALFSDRPNL